MLKKIRLFTLILLSLLVLTTVVGCESDKGEKLVEELAAEKIPEKEAENKIKQLIRNMSLEEKIGQMLMPDFRKWDSKNVTIINDEIASIIKDCHLGGIILFKENFVDRNQTKQLLQDFQSSSDIPLMLAVDQEGGLVTRIPFAPRMPGNMALGATADTKMAKKVGLAIGSELNRLGIHINFGPVLDINNNPENPVIGVRSFGDNPEVVTKMGLAYMQGLNESGVAAVGKHFPGHGDVDLDSHFVLPSSNKTLDQIKELELKPFQAAINEGIQGIMTAHINFNKIEPETAISIKDGLPIEIPATLSSRIMNDLLRKEMDFKGLLFTDAMNMKAVSNHFKPVDAAIRAINAGTDVILMPTDTKLIYEGLIEAVKTGEISEKRIDESVERILKFKNEYVFDTDKNSKSIIDSVEALEIEKQAANSSITLVENNGAIPLKLNNKERIAIIGFDSKSTTRMQNAIKKHYWNVKSFPFSKSLNYNGKLTVTQKKNLKDVSTVIVVTKILNQKKDSWQVDTVKSIISEGVTTIVVAAGNPYDAIYLKDADSFIAQYDTGIASFNATSDVIFGKLEATGKLPVNLLK